MCDVADWFNDLRMGPCISARACIVQVLDNHQGKDGDVIAEIPILISARAVFSK